MRDSSVREPPPSESRLVDVMRVNSSDAMLYIGVIAIRARKTKINRKTKVNIMGLATGWGDT